MKDYYYILGLKTEASLEEIKKSYRKLSLKFHPDKNDGDEFFSERFKEIYEAYETLSDTIKRANYDRIFTSNNQTGNSNNGYNFDPIIEYFKANKAEFEFEEEITFSWKTINSDRVTIKPFGVVLSIGQKTYRIKDFKNSELAFELVAENTNIKRYVKQSLKLKNKTFQELYSYFKNMIEVEKQTKTNSDKTNNFKSKESNLIGEFETDKGKIKVELNFSEAGPATNNKVYQNDLPAKDGKYKLGFMDYLIIKDGIIVDITMF